MTAETLPATNPRADLRRFIQKCLDDEGITAHHAAGRTQIMSYESLSAILRGKGPERPTSRLLRGIAEALRVPESRVFDVVGRSVPEPWPWPERYNVLNRTQRDIVESVAAGFLELMEPTERTRP